MSTLEILGQGMTGDYLWINLNGYELDVSPAELAIARRSVQRGYSARLHGCWLDESQLDTLIKAMDSPQPFWPPMLCEDGECGTEASVRVDGRLYCHGHAAGHTAREEGQ